MFTLANVVFDVAMFTIVISFCFINYLLLLQEKLKHLRGRFLIKALQLQKESDLLVGEFNRIHRGFLIAMFTVSNSMLFILGIYIWVKHHKHTALPMLLIMGTVIFDIILLIIECDGKIKAQLYEMSQIVLRNIRSNQYLMTNSYLRRCYKSWRPLRIYLGSTNFYEAATPLVLMDFLVGQTVALLLM